MWQDLAGFAGRSLPYSRSFVPGTLKTIKVKFGIRLLKEGDSLDKGYEMIRKLCEEGEVDLGSGPKSGMRAWRGMAWAGQQSIVLIIAQINY